MKKTAVIYWSGTGNTEAMAMAVLEGARQVNPEAQLFTVSEISADEASNYDILILGCPAMGAEVLEETEFEPFFAELEGKIKDKRIALFGSYGWGDGEWMREWEERIQNDGASVLDGEGVIANGAPDAEAEEACRALGRSLAAAAE